MAFIPNKRTSTFVLGAALAAMATAVPGAADAQPYQAYAVEDSAILSGPSPDYPPVASLRQGDPVYVYGCLDGYSWCDVAAGSYRGWYDAGLLDYYDQGQPVPFYEYAYGIGLPIVSFSIFDYWGHWYRDRPFFYDRDRFAHIALPAPRHFDHEREFYRDPGHFDHARPAFGPGHPGFEGRPGEPAHPGAAPGRSGFEPSHGPGEPHPGPQAQRPQGPPPQAQHMQGQPQMPRPQGQPQMQRPQGAPAMQRPGGPPQGQQHPAPQGQPHPQAQGQPHPQGQAHPQGHPENDQH